MHAVIARWLLALLCGAQGIGTLAIDLNHTHACNPSWTRHARFHVVWQTIDVALLALAEVVLVVAEGPFRDQRFYLAAVLASIPMLGFFAAFVSQRIYGGALSDPNGIRPQSLVLFGSERAIDLNFTVELMALVILVGIVELFMH
jgi:hypothetical protein